MKPSEVSASTTPTPPDPEAVADTFAEQAEDFLTGLGEIGVFDDTGIDPAGLTEPTTVESLSKGGGVDETGIWAGLIPTGRESTPTTHIQFTQFLEPPAGLTEERSRLSVMISRDITVPVPFSHRELLTTSAPGRSVGFSSQVTAESRVKTSESNRRAAFSPTVISGPHRTMQDAFTCDSTVPDVLARRR